MRRARPRGQAAGSGDLLDLAVFQLDRRGAAEDRHGDAQAGPLLVDVLDRAVEAGERTVGDADVLADLEADRGLRTLDALFDGADDALTSFSETGIGLEPEPRKPVTFGVFLTR